MIVRMSTTQAIPTIVVSARQARQLQLLGAGVYAPVLGYLDAESVARVLAHSTLPDGTPWSEPIALALHAPAESDQCVLKDGEGRTLGVGRISTVANSDGTRNVIGRPTNIPAELRLSTLVDSISASGRFVAYAVDGCLHKADVAHLLAQVPDDTPVLELRQVDCSDEPCHMLHATELANTAAIGRLAPRPVTVFDLPRLTGPLLNRQETLERIAGNLGAARLLPALNPEPQSRGLRDQSSGPNEQGVSTHQKVIGAVISRRFGVVSDATWPDVAAVLRAAYLPAGHRGLTILLTGLSGSGKSTIARVLTSTLMTRTLRPVSLLDGDLIRHHLSRGLGFSRADREANLMRIAFVAREITRHGGIAICAPIAPYAAIRKQIRDWVSEVGEFVEIHVATPIEVCEQRDPKGLYAKARAGELTGFTGVDDPYEEPADPELRLDTSSLSLADSVSSICAYLINHQLLIERGSDDGSWSI